MDWSWADVLDRGSLAELFRLNLDILVRTLCLISAFVAESLAGVLWGRRDPHGLGRLGRLSPVSVSR